MDKPTKIGDEYWWIPSVHPGALCARTSPGESYQDAVWSKIIELVEKEGLNESIHLVNSVLPELSLGNVTSADALASWIVDYDPMSAAIKKAKWSPSEHNSEESRAIVEGRSEVGLWDILELAVTKHWD